MGLTATENSGSNFEPIPEKMHHAICNSIYDLGTQFNEHFGVRQHKVLFCWELPEERITIEKEGEEKDLPRQTSKEYTLSLSEKANLRKDLETWRGKAFTAEELKGFDIKNVLGVNCTIQIIHKTKGDKTYANVSAIFPLMDKSKKRNPENPLKFFSFEDDSELPEDVPEWILKKIQSAEEWGKSDPDQPESSPPGWETIMDDDLPF